MSHYAYGVEKVNQADRYDYLESKTKRVVRALESFPAEGVDKDVVNYMIFLLNLMRSWFRAKEYGYEEDALGIAEKMAKGSKALRDKAKATKTSLQEKEIRDASR